MKSLIERLYKKQTLSSEELHVLLENCDDYHLNLINKLAQTVAQTHFGKKIFVRGLIEIGNCCHNNSLFPPLGETFPMLPLLCHWEKRKLEAIKNSTRQEPPGISFGMKHTIRHITTCYIRALCR